MRSLVNFQSIVVCTLSLISVVLSLPDGSAAQEHKGGISGRVTDNSAGVLQGAQIELQPKNVSLASNGQGEDIVVPLPVHLSGDDVRDGIVLRRWTCSA